MAKFRVGQNVKWDWGKGEGEGKIVERYTEKVTKTLKGSKVTRNATKDEPAFLIEQSDGDEVIKSESELSPAK